MPVNSKKKGSKGERDIVHYFTAITGHQWFRTSNSGAMATAQGISDYRFQGDIFTDKPEYDFVVEVKYFKDRIMLEHLFAPNNILWKKYVAQAETESHGKPWVLVLHPNLGGTFVLLPVPPAIELAKFIADVEPYRTNTIGLQMSKKRYNIFALELKKIKQVMNK